MVLEGGKLAYYDSKLVRMPAGVRVSASPLSQPCLVVRCHGRAPAAELRHGQGAAEGPEDPCVLLQHLAVGACLCSDKRCCSLLPTLSSCWLM
jgi:hypothetical protein